ncbi:hypothetical protein CJ226_09060 [Microbacterium sp. UMB0228]|nr:hypothetical protein CJ226_09060 [Microbacterium sp. UMB0228]
MGRLLADQVLETFPGIRGTQFAGNPLDQGHLQSVCRMQHERLRIAIGFRRRESVVKHVADILPLGCGHFQEKAGCCSLTLGIHLGELVAVRRDDCGCHSSVDGEELDYGVIETFLRTLFAKSCRCKRLANPGNYRGAGESNDCAKHHRPSRVHAGTLPERGGILDG